MATGTKRKENILGWAKKTVENSLQEHCTVETQGEDGPPEPSNCVDNEDGGP